MNFKTVALTTAAFVAVAAFAGQGFAQSRDQIRAVGSSTVFPFTTAVAENFGRGGKFKTPVVESTGTGGGFKLFCQGVGPAFPDVSNASRPITKSEIETCKSNGVTAVTEIVIGYDGISIAFNKASKHFDLTVATLWKALAKDVPVDGKMVANPYKKWSDIDPSLPTSEILVFGRPTTSGTRDAFVDLIMTEGCKKVKELEAALPAADARAKACATFREDGAHVEAGDNNNLIVQKLVANPNAVGYFGFSYLDSNRDKLQAAKLDGVEPSFDDIRSHKYEASRPLFIYIKNAHVGVIPGIKEFVAEYMSDRTLGDDGYLVDKGLIPLEKDKREKSRVIALNLTPMQF